MQQRKNVTAVTVSTLDMISTSGDCVSLQVCICHFENGETRIYLQSNKFNVRFCVKEGLQKKEKHKRNKFLTYLMQWQM